MNLKQLNGRQARWAIKLAAYDFNILHWAGKTNPADAPSRRPDYKVSENMGRLLPTLQRKLAAMPQGFGPSINALISQISAKSDLETTLAVISRGYRRSLWAEGHDCQGQVNRRFREPPFGNEPKDEYGYTPSPHPCNVAEELLNPVAGTTGCKQFVPRALVQLVTNDETVHDDGQLPFLELVHLLQNSDVLTAKVR